MQEWLQKQNVYKYIVALNLLCQLFGKFDEYILNLIGILENLIYQKYFQWIGRSRISLYCFNYSQLSLVSQGQTHVYAETSRCWSLFFIIQRCL